MFAETISAFFDVASGFAVSATWTPGAGSPVAGVLIFDHANTVLEDLGVVTSEPMATMPTSQWAAIAVGDTVTISAVAYRVRSILAEGDGATTRLVLTRSA
jgi:hypothetical protein